MVKTTPLLLRIVLMLSLTAASAVAHTPRLTHAQVLKIARSAGEKAGFNLREFREPRVEFEFTKKDYTWTVFFEWKTVPFGGDFLVWVDDRTGKARVMPGE